MGCKLYALTLHEHIYNLFCTHLRHVKLIRNASRAYALAPENFYASLNLFSLSFVMLCFMFLLFVVMLYVPVNSFQSCWDNFLFS